MTIIGLCVFAYWFERYLKDAQKRKDNEKVYVSSYSIDSEIRFRVNEISELKKEKAHLESQLSNKKHTYIDLIEMVNPKQIKCLKSEISRHQMELEKLINGALPPPYSME